MNSREIDRCLVRLERLHSKGLGIDDAERLADKMMLRDRDGDERRLCLECSHLHGLTRWSCGNVRQAEVPHAGLARELVFKLQRCPGFQEA